MITRTIFDWASKTPDRTAVIYNGRAGSYRSLSHAIAVAQGYFARRGYVGPGYAVLAVRRLLDFWVLSLALRELGLTTMVVPSVEDIVKIDLPNLRCVVTAPGEPWPGLDELCKARGLDLLSVSLSGEPDQGPAMSEAPRAFGGHILRTSGTTGVYKMVLMTPAHDAVRLSERVAFLGLNQDTVFCVFRLGAWTGSGYAWPATTWTVGGTVVFEQRLEAHLALMIPGITHAVLEPSTLAAILATPVGAFPRSDSMRLAVTGEAMTQNQIDQAKARITPLLFNYLGSTEAGGIALTLLESSEDQKWHKLVPNRVVEIVDEFDRRVPTGQIGRLRISTAGGPTGYLNDEAATRDFFKDGFFYTGDLAVMRADGRMALQGRFTDVINVGGLKISPAPVEERLSELFGASGVCLFSMPGDDDAEDIHVVVETATPIDSERLIAAVRRELPGLYQVRVHSVAALPRNQMGKIVRQAIRAEASARRPPSAGMTEPR